MLDFDIAIELMKKYGFSSTSSHPYIYQNGDTIGICYTYNDEDYGQLERIKLFDNVESFEEFLKQLQWVKNNGLNYHVKMSLDNYEIMNPKVLFLRNGKVMVEGEMFDIENFDYRESQRLQMDDVSQIIYEAGDLLLCYDEMKARQLQYLQNIVSLKNTLRSKYFELQKEVDAYNKYKVERNLTLLPDVTDIGINASMEITIKDRYNMYIAQRPSYEEAMDFLRDVWELNKQLDLNTKYYEALKEENDTRNELKVVEQKIEMMKDLNSNVKPLFGIDLVSRFKKINRTWSDLSTSVSVDNIKQIMSRVGVKYSFFDRLNVLYSSDYLKEAIQNTNYEDLADKYAKNSNPDEVNKNKMAPNEIAASLSVQYRDKLTPSEQAMLILYNNHKLRKLCNAILNIENFETTPIKSIVSKINSMVGFSKIKTECYDLLKKRLEDPINQNIKSMLFSNFDFTSFESYLASLVANLTILKKIDNKMTLNGDLDMYLKVHNVEEISRKKFALVSNDLTALLNETKNSKDIIAIVLLKESTPVMYAPYYFDIGDVYNKDASNQMYVKEMVDFEILVDMSDIVFNLNPIRVPVARYYSEISALDNYSLVSEIKMAYKTDFCKYTFYGALGDKKTELVQPTVLETPEANVTIPVHELPSQATSVSEVQQSVDVSRNVSEVSTVENVAVNNSKTGEVKETTTTPAVKPAVASESGNNTSEQVEQKVAQPVKVQEEQPKGKAIAPNEETTVKKVPEDKPVVATDKVARTEAFKKQPVAETVTHSDPVASTGESKAVPNNKDVKPVGQGHPKVISKPQPKLVEKPATDGTVQPQPKPVTGAPTQPKPVIASSAQKLEIVKPIVKTDEEPKSIAGTSKLSVEVPKLDEESSKAPVCVQKPMGSAAKPVIKSSEINSPTKSPNAIKLNGEGTMIVKAKSVARPVATVAKTAPSGVAKPIANQSDAKPVISQGVVKVVTSSGEVKTVPKTPGMVKTVVSAPLQHKPVEKTDNGDSAQPKPMVAPIKKDESNSVKIVAEPKPTETIKKTEDNKE